MVRLRIARSAAAKSPLYFGFCAYVGVLPRPEHRQEVVGVAPSKITLQDSHRIFHRSQSDFAILLLAKEILRECPARIDPAECAQSLDWRSFVPSFRKRSIRH